MTIAEELRAAAEALTGDAPVYAPGTARITPNPAENELLISVCDQHDGPTPGARYDVDGHCQSCVFVRLHASEMRFTQQLAALINARKPLAVWVEVMADIAAYAEARGYRTATQTDAALAVARQINSTPGPS